MDYNESNTEQTNDIAAAWIDDLHMYKRDLGDRLHVMVVTHPGGRVVDEFYSREDEHGETRENISALRSAVGERRTRDALANSGFTGKPKTVKWNKITKELAF